MYGHEQSQDSFSFILIHVTLGNC